MCLCTCRYILLHTNPWPCLRRSWSSTTSLKCGASPGSDLGASALHAIMVAASLVGTGRGGWTFDSPVLSGVLQTNAPSSRNSVITVAGTNFQLSDASPTVGLGVAECASTSWLSMTTLGCSLRSKSAPTSIQHVRIGVHVGTSQDLFTLDPPVRACLYTCLYTCLYVCLYTCVYACLHACLCARLYTCLCRCLHACLDTGSIAAQPG